jgi:hypothetical protein
MILTIVLINDLASSRFHYAHDNGYLSQIYKLTKVFSKETRQTENRKEFVSFVE